MMKKQILVLLLLGVALTVNAQEETKTRVALLDLQSKNAPEGLAVAISDLLRVELIKAGAFGEHHFTEVRHGDAVTRVDRQFFQVRLQPGAVGRLEIGMKRFVHPPSYRFPWHRP